MAPDTGTTYQFGPFLFDAAGRVLYRDGQVVPLSPKVADTLAVLLAHRGRVVEKGELMKLVWPDTFVEEGGLARNVSALRKALGDAEGAGYVETVPKRGYRFCGQLREPAPAALAVPHPPAWSPGRRALAGVLAAGGLLAATLAYLHRKPAETGFHADAVAVLPLRNVSGDLAQEYFSEGMTDTLATELAKSGIPVIVPGAVRRVPADATPKEIGRQLKADAVLRGTVLAAAGRVRINAQLVEAATGRVVWSGSYQRDLRDVLTLQAEVAMAVVREVTSSVAAGSRHAAAPARPVVPAAYQDYLKGRYFWNKRTEAALRKAVAYFQGAIAKDGTYAPAFAGLADAYALLASSGYDAMPPREAMPLARSAALRALALDPGLAEAHTSLAYVLMAYDWDLPAARREFRRALQANPGYATAHHWYAHFLLASGQPDQAAAEMRVAQGLDPLSLPVNVGVGWCAYFARRYDEAIEQYRKALELDPDFPVAHQALGMALERKGAWPEAIAEFRKAAALAGGSAGSLASLGHAYALAGDGPQARAQLQRLAELSARRYVPAIYPALVWLGLGDRERAAEWLAKARQQRPEYLIYAPYDPQLDSFRTNRRLASLLRP